MAMISLFAVEEDPSFGCLQVLQVSHSCFTACCMKSILYLIHYKIGFPPQKLSNSSNYVFKDLSRHLSYNFLPEAHTSLSYP